MCTVRSPACAFPQAVRVVVVCVYCWVGTWQEVLPYILCADLREIASPVDTGIPLDIQSWKEGILEGPLFLQVCRFTVFFEYCADFLLKRACLCAIEFGCGAGSPLMATVFVCNMGCVWCLGNRWDCGVVERLC